MDPPPGGSGRYRPAAARVGGERAAVGRREAGGALAGRQAGGSGATGGREQARGGRERGGRSNGSGKSE